MKKTIKLNSRGIYLIRSSACVNSTYFENQVEIELFWRLFRIHLRNYIDILEYNLNKYGFQMIIRVKPKKKVISSFKRFKKFKNSEYIWNDTEVWRIISEKFRVFLGQYVPQINKLRGSVGSLVRRSYERFEFDSKEEAMDYLRRIKESQVDQSQPLLKYQSKKGHGINHTLKSIRFLISSLEYSNNNLRFNHLKGIKVFDYKRFTLTLQPFFRQEKNILSVS